MSLDGFIAGPGNAQEWIFDFMANDAPWLEEAAAATGAMLVCVLPVLLGDGIRFSAPGLGRIDLEPVSSTQADGVTILRFRVRK
jgi:hypothetical protein